MKAVVALIVLGTLAACGSKEAKKTEGSSFGQVLPGSASDAMLPYDTASSAPPLEPPSYGADDDTSASEPGSGSASGGPVEAAAAPEPDAT